MPLATTLPDFSRSRVAADKGVDRKPGSTRRSVFVAKRAALVREHNVRPAKNLPISLRFLRALMTRLGVLCVALSIRTRGDVLV